MPSIVSEDDYSIHPTPSTFPFISNHILNATHSILRIFHHSFPSFPSDCDCTNDDNAVREMDPSPTKPCPQFPVFNVTSNNGTFCVCSKWDGTVFKLNRTDGPA